MRQLVFLLILSLGLTGNVLAQPQVDLGSDEGVTGETVQIPITLTNEAGTNLMGIGVDIGYDVASLENPQCTAGPAATDANKSCLAGNPSTGVFRIGIIGLNTNVIGDGVLATVSFHITSTATPGTKLLTNTPSASDLQGNPVVVGGANGSVTVLGCATDEECDGIDNDCNGLVDDITPEPTTCGTGACASTGQLICQGGVPVDTCTPGAPKDEECNNLDDDCNGLVDDGMVFIPETYCGVGACENIGTMICLNGELVDTCQPLPAGYEGLSSSASCADQIDNDCDTFVDAADPDCAAPLVEQMCFDNVDDDGDGLIDCADPDCANVTGPATTCGVGACAAGGTLICEGGALVDTCTPLAAGTEGPPGGPTCADEIDNDCDGFVDAADGGCSPGLWRSGESDLGNGWKWLDWFGYYSTASEPWIYHQEHQWLYPYDDGAGGVFFWYDDMQEFVWTDSETYPYLYRFGGSPGWLWYQKDSANPRWFFNYAAGAWEQLP